jgi:hypothetical protein
LDGRAKWPAMARVGRSRLMMMGVLARSAFASTTCCSLPLGRGVFLFILRLTFGHARGAPPAYQRAGGRSIQAAGVLPRRRSKQLRVRVWACARRRPGRRPRAIRQQAMVISSLRHRLTGYSRTAVRAAADGCRDRPSRPVSSPRRRDTLTAV